MPGRGPDRPAGWGRVGRNQRSSKTTRPGRHKIIRLEGMPLKSVGLINRGRKREDEASCVYYCCTPSFPIPFGVSSMPCVSCAKKASSPPLGLITVAALLPSTWEKRLVDVNVARLRDRDVAWADIVMISAMIVQRESAHALIARCKKSGQDRHRRRPPLSQRIRGVPRGRSFHPQ